MRRCGAKVAVFFVPWPLAAAQATPAGGSATEIDQSTPMVCGENAGSIPVALTVQVVLAVIEVSREDVVAAPHQDREAAVWEYPVQAAVVR
jgi:hypothetical protein